MEADWSQELSQGGGGGRLQSPSGNLQGSSRWRAARAATDWREHCAEAMVTRMAVHPGRQREGHGVQLIAGAAI